MADYIKNTKGALYAQLLNLKTVAPGQGAILGFSAAETSAVLASVDQYLQAEDYTTTLRDASKAGTEKAAAQWKVTQAVLRSYLQRVKKSTGYTVEIGKLLGIEPEVQTVTKVQEKPVLKTAMKGGSLEIRFTKHGRDAMNIYSKRGAETEYTFMATCLTSPYKDKRENLVANQPEKRMYQGFFVDADEQQGSPSDETSIVV